MQKSLSTTILLAALTAAAPLHAATIVPPSCSFDYFTGTDQKSKDGNFQFHSGSYDRAPEFIDGNAVFGPEGTDILNITKVNGSSGSLGAIGGTTGTTITMTISGLSLGTGNAPHAIFTAVGGNSVKWGLGLTADGKITGTWDNAVWADPRNVQLDIPSTGSFILTTVSLGANTLIYINGSLAETITGLGTGASNNINYLMAGSTSSGNNKGASLTLGNLYVHDHALNASEVAAFTASVPEPATASLGALGLAALLLRRRRQA